MPGGAVGECEFGLLSRGSQVRVLPGAPLFSESLLATREFAIPSHSSPAFGLRQFPRGSESPTSTASAACRGPQDSLVVSIVAAAGVCIPKTSSRAITSVNVTSPRRGSDEPCRCSLPFLSILRSDDLPPVGEAVFGQAARTIVWTARTAELIPVAVGGLPGVSRRHNRSQSGQ